MSEARSNSLSEHILRAVARHLDFRQGVLVPEAVVTYVKDHRPATELFSAYDFHGQYLADLMWVTASRYATEIEIKASRADWRADKLKDKWGRLPPWIARFIYAVPEELGIPDFVPIQAGVWHYKLSRWYSAEITVARAPKRIGKETVPQSVIETWLGHLHCRFWHQRLYVNNRLPRIAAAEPA